MLHDRKQNHEYYREYFGKAPKGFIPTTHEWGVAPVEFREPTDKDKAAAPVDPATWDGRFHVPFLFRCECSRPSQLCVCPG